MKRTSPNTGERTPKAWDRFAAGYSTFLDCIGLELFGTESPTGETDQEAIYRHYLDERLAQGNRSITWTQPEETL